MPAYYDQPAIFQQGAIDPAQFSQLPFYQVKNEVKQFPRWKLFDMLYGKIDWISNEGSTMKGLTPQGSPVGRSFFFPNPLTTVANKDVYTVTESSETAIIFHHKYESFQFNFLPSFQVFWDTYIQFANSDIVEKIACSNEQFIETNMWFNASYMWLAGTGLIGGLPTAMGNTAGNAAGSKTNNWLLATVQGTGGVAGVLQGLTLRDLYNICIGATEDLGIPPFEGIRNMPKDNEGLKGKHLIVMSSEAYMNLTFDPDIQVLKPLDLDLLHDDLHGSLFGKATVKFHRYPIRFSPVNIADGAGNVLYPAGYPIAPEVFDATDNKRKPNPYYTSLISAPYEVGWYLGESFCKTIKVGPPPKEFTAVNMSAQKFYGMRWNGEVRLTDQVLITNPNGTVSLNSYGENLQMQSRLVHGYLVGERRFGFPIVYLRKRPALKAA